MKILIVEDEMIISDDIASMLESQGYDVTDQVLSYDEATASIQNNLPDMVLLDINLQGDKDGIHIAKYINDTHKIPFIYTSSLSDESTIARAKETNPSTYLVKPFQDEQLFAAIEIALSNFSMSKSNSTDKNEDEEKLAIFNNAIFIKDGHRYKKLDLEDIVYVQKSHNYLEIHSESSKYLIRVSMGNFIDQIEKDALFRVHKSYAINPHRITEVLPSLVKLGDIEVPLSRGYADELKRHLRIF